RYQAEDKATTTQPTATRGVSALLTGNKSMLIPENSERMARRRLHVITNHETNDRHEANGHHGNGCCGGNGRGEEESLPALRSGRTEELISLNGLIETYNG